MPNSPAPSRYRYRPATSPRYAGSAGSAAQAEVTVSTSSAAGTTSSSRQPFEWPTSMYSMKRSVTPVSRAHRAIGTIDSSLIPRRTTMLILTGVKPASSAAPIPSSTLATGKSTPFIAPNVASSSESRLTVTRLRPASASGPESARSAAPFVVRVRSSSRPSGVRSSPSILISWGRPRRTRGSPPVIRSFSTPSCTKAVAARWISSNDSTWSFGRNA